MNNVHSDFVKADQLLAAFSEKEDKFIPRFVSLLDNMLDFIDKAEVKGKVVVNEMALGYMLLDYFEDIRRLKSFHGIEHVNSIKIVAYTSYWFLRRKPMQILEQDKNLFWHTFWIF